MYMCRCKCTMYIALLCIAHELTGCGVPEGMAVHSIHGFVEELVVNDDPEYQVHNHVCIVGKWSKLT